ncbi:MAG: hypothetical protein NTY07_05670 [Bacteroidia bacterium]|nr:hypothetical protein [Bacteroidia bacterium]
MESEKDTIRKIFSDWQIKEIKAHHFWAKDSCNWAYIDKYGIDRWKHDNGWGFPDSSEIKFSPRSPSFATRGWWPVVCNE